MLRHILFAIDVLLGLALTYATQLDQKACSGVDIKPQQHERLPIMCEDPASSLGQIQKKPLTPMWDVNKSQPAR